MLALFLTPALIVPLTWTAASFAHLGAPEPLDFREYPLVPAVVGAYFNLSKLYYPPEVPFNPTHHFGSLPLPPANFIWGFP